MREIRREGDGGRKRGGWVREGGERVSQTERGRE